RRALKVKAQLTRLDDTCFDSFVQLENGSTALSHSEIALDKCVRASAACSHRGAATRNRVRRFKQFARPRDRVFARAQAGGPQEIRRRSSGGRLRAGRKEFSKPRRRSRRSFRFYPPATPSPARLGLPRFPPARFSAIADAIGRPSA